MAVDRVVEPGRQLVTRAVEQVIQHWNARTLSEALDEGFYDRERLLQSMDARVPRDARIRILSVRGTQTLRQFVQPATEERERQLVTVVSVTVNTQLEFDSASGPNRLPGVNEFILQISEAR